MHDALTLIVALLGTAVAAVVLFRRLGMPPILAYLLCGLAAGPFGFGWVNNTDGIQHLAEFGIVFLLFTLGLEFSIPRLMTLRRIVFGAGPLQVLPLVAPAAGRHRAGVPTITLPPRATQRTSANASRSVLGSPATAIRSATNPGATVPTSSPSPRDLAASEVADRIAGRIACPPWRIR